MKYYNSKYTPLMKPGEFVIYVGNFLSCLALCRSINRRYEPKIFSAFRFNRKECLVQRSDGMPDTKEAVNARMRTVAKITRAMQQEHPLKSIGEILEIVIQHFNR